MKATQVKVSVFTTSSSKPCLLSCIGHRRLAWSSEKGRTLKNFAKLTCLVNQNISLVQSFDIFLDLGKLCLVLFLSLDFANCVQLCYVSPGLIFCVYLFPS